MFNGAISSYTFGTMTTMEIIIILIHWIHLMTNRVDRKEIGNKWNQEVKLHRKKKKEYPEVMEEKVEKAETITRSLFAFEIPTYVNIQRLFSIMVPSTFVQRLV